jgi:hypothetical protein
VVGDANDQPLFHRWAENMPLRLNGDSFETSQSVNPMETVRLWLDSASKAQGQQLADVINGGTPPEGVAMQFESPQERGRTVVVLVGRDARSVETLSAFVMPGNIEGRTFGNISFLTSDRFESFTWNPRPYFIGELSWYQMLVFWVARYFLLLPVAVLLLGLLLAGWMNGWLKHKAELRLQVQSS